MKKNLLTIIVVNLCFVTYTACQNHRSKELKAVDSVSVSPDSTVFEDNNPKQDTGNEVISELQVLEKENERIENIINST